MTTQGRVKRGEIYTANAGFQKLSVPTPSPAKEASSTQGTDQQQEQYLYVRSPKGQSLNTHICGIYYIPLYTWKIKMHAHAS